MGGEIFGSVGVNSYFALGPKLWVLARGPTRLKSRTPSPEIKLKSRNHVEITSA